MGVLSEYMSVMLKGVGFVYTVYNKIPGQHVDNGRFDRWLKLRMTDCVAILSLTHEGLGGNQERKRFMKHKIRMILNTSQSKHYDEAL